VATATPGVPGVVTPTPIVPPAAATTLPGAPGDAAGGQPQIPAALPNTGVDRVDLGLIVVVTLLIIAGGVAIRRRESLR
jgi:LPXTG-motif cell wall-anchored protein